MILSLQDLLNQYKDYTDPQGKISRMVKKGELYRVTQGIYETNRNVDGKKLAQVIYHPSYLSFTYVLSLYSLIPGKTSKYLSINSLASNKSIPKSSDKPKPLLPYNIPKLTAFAFLRISLVTS